MVRYPVFLSKSLVSEKEREVIQTHVIMTYRMLSQISYPKELQNIPEIASSHHERIDGTGYPCGLLGKDMLLRSRIVAIADIFEALSAPDRPYKNPLPVSQVLKIMQEMVDESHLDKDLFDVFVNKKVYLQYAKQYLSSDQIDSK